MLGAGIAELITLPVSVVKTNYQCDTRATLRGTIQQIYAKHGIRGFYMSSRASLCAQTVSTSSKYVLYNFFKSLNPGTSSVIHGICSGICASVLSHPLEVIKIYQQRSQCLRTDLRLTGPKLMYRGYSKSLVRNIMVSSMLFPLYDFYTGVFPGSVILSSFCTSCSVTLILHPIDLLRTRHISLGGAFNTDFNIYRGLHLNMLRVVPTFMITMAITEHVKARL